MKYYLSTAGKKACKGCTWLLSLAKKENGYDLIQFKRGLSANRDLMKLYSGEPAIILDTGEFFVGDAAGNPIRISTPLANGIACVIADTSWRDKDEVVVRYADMITSDGVTPTEADSSVFGGIILLNEDQIPIGIGSIVNWVAGSDSATLLLGYFSSINITEFTTADVDLIIQHAEAGLNP